MASKKQNVNESYEEAIAELSNVVISDHHDLRSLAVAKVKQLTAELEAAASCESHDADERIRSGFLHFKTQEFDKRSAFFHKLAQAQTPKFIVFACSDSRVSPTRLLNFDFGEAFVVRNIANIIPPYDQIRYCGVGACLEYAITNLKVENILIMGHSRCGGIKELMDIPADGTVTNQFIDNWVKLCSAAKEKVKVEDGESTPYEVQCYHCEKEAVNVSLGNLLTYPFVREGVAKKTLTLKGAHYDFVHGIFQLWNYDLSISTTKQIF